MWVSFLVVMLKFKRQYPDAVIAHNPKKKTPGVNMFMDITSYSDISLLFSTCLLLYFVIFFLPSFILIRQLGLPISEDPWGPHCLFKAVVWIIPDLVRQLWHRPGLLMMKFSYNGIPQGNGLVSPFFSTLIQNCNFMESAGENWWNVIVMSILDAVWFIELLE